MNAPDKNINTAIFDNFDVRKFFVEMDGQRYLRDSVLLIFTENHYIDQCRDLKIFYKVYVGEELLNPFISYNDMKKNHSIQVIDIRFQVNHITPKKIQIFEEDRCATSSARLFVILIRRREIEPVSDGNKLIEV